MTDFSFQWDMGQAEVQLLGGMLGPITFTLENGEKIQPMSVAPWASDRGQQFDELPGHLKRMRGEWPCIPFGHPFSPSGLPEEWTAIAESEGGGEYHGFAANNLWHLESREAGGLAIAIDYPEDHAVERLTRAFKGVEGAPALEITLCIEARKDTRLPGSLHPVFRLPSEPGGMRIRPPNFAAGFCYPVSIVEGVSQLEPGAAFHDLGAVPAKGGFADMRRVPLPRDTEEIVQICGVDGPVALDNQSEGYLVTLDFDRDVFPSVLFWYSNRGRSRYPWNGRHVALGVEPLRSPFDFGPEVGRSPDNPIARAGFSTALPLWRNKPLCTTYSIAVEKI